MTGAEQRALVTLRRMIIDRELMPGERLSEVSAARMLGVSRTPIRTALRVLAYEGIIRKRDGRGYTIQDLQRTDIEKSVLVRGVLEGFAAGQMAMNGLSNMARDIFSRSLAISADAILRDVIREEDVKAYEEANDLFHKTIIDEADNPYIKQSYSGLKYLSNKNEEKHRNIHKCLEQARIRMTIGHTQHQIIIDAIENKEALRAEMMMREHAQARYRYRRLFSEYKDCCDGPGVFIAPF